MGHIGIVPDLSLTMIIDNMFGPRLLKCEALIGH